MSIRQHDQRIRHELKIFQKYLDELFVGEKTFEYRKDDREPGFAVHDFLHLREWDPDTLTYTGRSIFAEVVSVLRGPELGVPRGYAVMSIHTIQTNSVFTAIFGCEASVPSATPAAYSTEGEVEAE